MSVKLASTDAEVQAVFSILNSFESVKIDLLNKLTPEYFGYDTMCKAYDLITNLTKKALTLPSIETFASTPGVTDEMRNLLFREENVAVTSSDDVKNLLTTLDYYRKIRAIYNLSALCANHFQDTDNPDLDPLVSKMEQTLMSLRMGKDEFRMSHFGRGSAGKDDPYIEQLVKKEARNLIPSTFQNFDKHVGGFEKSFLIFFASHAKGGKSTVALNMLVNQYLQYSLDVCYISLEMSEQELRDCISSKISGVEHKNIRQGTLTDAEIRNISVAWRKFNEHGMRNGCRFTVWCPPTISAMELRVNLKPLNYSVICVDYINLMSTAEHNLPLHEKLNLLGRDLKQTAKDLNALIVVPAQMNPDGDVRYSKSMREHANDIWSWFYGEEEKATKQITVKELVSRGWGDFSFRLEADFEHKTVTDSSVNFANMQEGDSKPLESMC